MIPLTSHTCSNDDDVFCRCNCALCAPHVGDASTSGSCESDEESDVSRALADAAKLKEDQDRQRARADPDAALAALRAQKREAIRKAVEAQREELAAGRR